MFSFARFLSIPPSPLPSSSFSMLTNFNEHNKINKASARRRKGRRIEMLVLKFHTNRVHELSSARLMSFRPLCFPLELVFSNTHIQTNWNDYKMQVVLFCWDSNSPNFIRIWVNMRKILANWKALQLTYKTTKCMVHSSFSNLMVGQNEIRQFDFMLYLLTVFFSLFSLELAAKD